MNITTKKGLSAGEAFEHIYENGECSHLVCRECGSRVERGIRSVSHHWVNCSGKNFFGELMKQKEEKDILNISDIENIQNKTLK